MKLTDVEKIFIASKMPYRIIGENISIYREKLNTERFAKHRGIGKTTKHRKQKIEIKYQKIKCQVSTLHKILTYKKLIDDKIIAVEELDIRKVIYKIERLFEKKVKIEDGRIIF